MTNGILGTEEPTETQADSDRVEVAEAATAPDDAPTGVKPPRRRHSVNVGIRGLIIATAIALLLGAVATLVWLYVGAHQQLAAQDSESANRARAEKIALDYAVNAATMNFKDLKPWTVALVAGTSPELSSKLTEAAKSMEQIMVPLEWTSTAEPLVAKVRSHVGAAYVVDCFVSVETKTVQAAEALQSTATYSVTIDSDKGWQITDVGGVGKVVGPK